ncbi:unnamed protein product, partial [Tetraodon nigroviridis]
MISINYCFLFLFPAAAALSMPQEVEDDYIKNGDENTASDEAVDTTKDPCQNVKCSRHKVCVAQGYQRAMCVNRRKLEQKVQQPGQPEGHERSCKSCPVTVPSPVCGSDGHNYASECKLEQQACLTGKDLSVMCTGFCPCAASTITESKRGKQLHPPGPGRPGRPSQGLVPAAPWQRQAEQLRQAWIGHEL